MYPFEPPEISTDTSESGALRSTSAVLSLSPHNDLASSDSSSDALVVDPLSTTLTTHLAPINSDPSCIKQLIVSNNDSPVLLYQRRLRPYSNGYYDRYAPKNYSPHDSMESYHNWAKREYALLTRVNGREGTVSLVLRFHCNLTKQELTALLSQLRKELKLLGLEWICIGDVTTRGGRPINRLHFHYSFDSKLSPDALGLLFQGACERAFYRTVRRSDFDTDAEYQTAIARRYRRHKTVCLRYSRDFTITDKGYVTDDGGNWSKFVRYTLKYRYSPYGVDPVPNYYTDGIVKNGTPLIRLFTKYKRGSGTKSLRRMYYSDGWFMGGTHQQLIQRYHSRQRALCLSFARSTIEPIESTIAKPQSVEGGLPHPLATELTESVTIEDLSVLKQSIAGHRPREPDDW